MASLPSADTREDAAALGRALGVGARVQRRAAPRAGRTRVPGSVLRAHSKPGCRLHLAAVSGSGARRGSGTTFPDLSWGEPRSPRL